MGRAVTRGFASLNQLHQHISTMIERGPAMLNAPYITVDGGEGPYPVSTVDLEDDVLMIRYGDFETGIASDTLPSMVATSLSVRGLDYDEEDFRLQMMDVSSDHYREEIAAGKALRYFFESDIGPWHSREVLGRLRHKHHRREPITDGEYYWLALVVGLWAMETDFTTMNQETEALLLEILHFYIYVGEVPMSGPFDMQEIEDKFQERIDRGWVEEEFDLIRQGNEEIYEEGEPKWAAWLKTEVDERGRGEDGTRADPAFRRFLPALLRVADDLHARCHPETDYKMQVQVR